MEQEKLWLEAYLDAYALWARMTANQTLAGTRRTLRPVVTDHFEQVAVKKARPFLEE